MQQIFRQWIGMHRAMIAWYHAAHHVTKGTGFGGDHVNIYGEIYTQLGEDLDMIVEKGIGLTGDETLADPISSLSLAATMLAQYPMAANQNAEMIARTAFEISKSYVSFLESVYSQFEACGMSLGLDDLLQGLANQYETYVYLLQQRSRGTSMKITETKLRKIIQGAILKEGPPGQYDYMDDLEYDEDGYLSVFANRTASGITSLAGMDRYGDHRGVFEVMREASEADREIERFFDKAAENCEELLASVEDERMELEDRAYEAGDDSEAAQAYNQYMEQEEETLRSQWSNSYNEFCGHMNVFSVPPEYYEHIFDFMYSDYMSADEVKRKISRGY